MWEGKKLSTVQSDPRNHQLHRDLKGYPELKHLIWPKEDNVKLSSEDRAGEARLNALFDKIQVNTNSADNYSYNNNNNNNFNMSTSTSSSRRMSRIVMRFDEIFQHKGKRDAIAT